MMMLMLMFACSDKEEVVGQEQVSIDPTQRGGWTVGTRDDSFANRHGQELNIQFWFPTEEVREGLHEYDGIITGTAQDGGAVNCLEPRPIVLFSHGNGGMRYQSYFLMEYLASHGFLVVAPDHVGNTAFDMDGSPRSELVFRRPEDIIDSYEFLLSEDRFSDCVDEEQGYAVIGHSFGGYTSIALAGAELDTEETANFCTQYPDAWLCDDVAGFAEENGAGVYDRSDPRIWASVPMTPAGYEALFPGLGSIEIPMLFWGGGKDELTAMEWSVRPLYDGVNSEKILAELPQAGHYTFTNACDILPTYDDCGEGFLPPEDAHVIVNEVTVAILIKQLGYKGWESSLPVDADELIWIEN
jgi:predicted dienelactone hydrolase